MYLSKMIRRFPFLLLAAGFILTVYSQGMVSAKTFTITAYYSPIPCQERYVTGSLFGDKVLNGNGTNGADGTPVYTGMVAAPSTYAFGTKMFIPGIGTVAVHDRGGAIVSSNQGQGVYDRLDIWMGYGDEGLTRALNWGRRTVDVTVYGIDNSIAEQINLMGYSPSEAIPNNCGMENVSVDYNTLQPVGGGPVPEAEAAPEPVAVVVPEPEPQPVIDIMGDNLSKGDSGENVKSLQTELSALNFYMGEINGVYGDVTEHAVFKFQQSQYLVGDASSLGAGVFGAKTRDALNDIVASRGYNEFLIATANDGGSTAWIADESSTPEVAVSSPEMEKTTLLASEMDFGLVSEDVKVLQQFLKDNGFFGGSFVTDFFGPATQEALIRFQIENGLVSSENDFGAGRVGPNTLNLINTLS